MFKADFVHVGLRLVFNETANTFRIENVYLDKSDGAHALFMVKGTREVVLRQTVEKVIEAFYDAYDGHIVKIWCKVSEYTTQRYLQLSRCGRPETVGLGGNWMLWAERGRVKK